MKTLRWESFLSLLFSQKNSRQSKNRIRRPEVRLNVISDHLAKRFCKRTDQLLVNKLICHLAVTFYQMLLSWRDKTELSVIHDRSSWPQDIKMRCMSFECFFITTQQKNQERLKCISHECYWLWSGSFGRKHWFDNTLFVVY